MKKLEELFEKLNLDKNNGLYYISEETWKEQLSLPSRIKRLLEEKIKPDAFFCLDNKPLILFFLSPTDRDIHKKIWNFNESPIVFILEDSAVTIFNGFKYINDQHTLAEIGKEGSLTDFTYFELVTGKTWEKYQNELVYKNRLDYFLLDNIKTARKILIDDNNLDTNVANALIGKCIFIRYLIDRKVNINIDGYMDEWNNDGVCNMLKNKRQTKRFFNYLKQKFNGDDIFSIPDNEYSKIGSDSLNVLIRLLQGEDLKVGQRSLFDVYDFSIISIEFISNVYELFIGKDKQEEKGAYYTPLFLVDYILEETIVRKFEKEPQLSDCVILDPACGSGIFLVEALRKIIEQHQRNKDLRLTTKQLCNLASKNIYGIDDDHSAVQVALFSIYLTLLDYQKPADIEKFKFPHLLNKNIFKANFFDNNAEYNNKFKSVQFDYILGNPPWKGSGLGTVGRLYLDERKKDEKQRNKKYEIDINNNEIVEGFVLRTSDFSNSETKTALIARSTILYNLGYNNDFSKFRRYWLEEYFLHKVVELAPVRHEVFSGSNDPAIAPAAILFFQYANGAITDDNVLDHITIKPSLFFSYFKIFTIMRHDFKQIQQRLLKENDWLFKTLVYGSYLDFLFIKRLKDKYTSIYKLILDKNNFVFGTGIHCRKNKLAKPKNTKKIKNLTFLDPMAIEAFHIDFSKKGVLERDKVDIVKDERLYHAPILLIRKGLDTNLLNTKAAISFKNAIFKDSITSVKSLNKKTDVLKTILGILTSDLYSYFAINTYVSIGIEREQTQNYNKFSVPYIDCNIVELVEEMGKAKQELFKENNKALGLNTHEIEKRIKKIRKEIDIAIQNSLKLTKIEKELMNYALTIIRPTISSHGEKRNNALKKIMVSLPDHSKEVIDYANVFLERFKPFYDNDKHKFIARVLYNERLLGIVFQVVPIKTYNEQGIVWEEKSENDFISFLIKLSTEKLTSRLFIQKDVRGFEKESFYIFKPNEKRLWHKAIAYLDVDEFMDAILRAGRDGK